MANFSSLKQAIQNYIKENGNKEITGNLLQEILLSMVVTMGDNAINSLTTFEARFNSTNNRVEFFNQSGDMLYWYDASAFVDTGLVKDVYIDGDNLVFVIDTQDGEKTIEVPLTDIFNPNNYYTKTQIDGIVRAIRELYDGAEYRGFITPSSQAESKQGVNMVCFATEAGTYTNFLANYDTPIVIPVRGIWVFKRGVDADDWTAYSLLEIDKVYEPAQASGMGRVVLQKNMVNGVNTLTQAAFEDSEGNDMGNTIYVIQYDFTLGENITVPANCVLEFDGGSINGKYTLIGNHTRIEYTVDTIFGSDITIDGFWDIDFILANWFKGTDTIMFQKSFATAYNLWWANRTNNHEHDYSINRHTNIKVTCLTKIYYIEDTIAIRAFTSFDANGAMFKPTNGLLNKFMFKCNVQSDSPHWIYSHPGNLIDEFCNLEYSNDDNIQTSLLQCGDSRHIHHIRAINPYRGILYTGDYIDNRILNDISITHSTTKLDTSSYSNFSSTCDIGLHLGDCASLRNVDVDGICVDGFGELKIAKSISTSFYLKNCVNAVISDLHDESSLGVFVDESVVKIKDSWIAARGSYWIKCIQANSVLSKVYLENCYFTKLRSLTSAGYEGFSPVSGYVDAEFKNVYGINSSWEGNNSNEETIMLKQDHTFINPVFANINYPNNIKDDFVYDNFETVNKMSVPRIADQASPALFIRLRLFVDTIRQLCVMFKNPSGGNLLEHIIKRKAESFSIENFSYDSFENFPGLILRIEVGFEEGVYSKYFDFGCVKKSCSYLRFNVTPNEDTYDIAFNGHPLKDIDYTPSYIRVMSYKRSGLHAEYLLSDNTLPITALLGDKCTLVNGKQYTRINSNWIDATGNQV